MKKVLFLLVMLLSSLCITAQQKVIQQGNNFQVEKTEKKSEDVKTPYTITIDGRVYPIYRGKKGGFYYYNKNNKRTYVPKEVSEKLKKIYNEK